MTTEKRIADHDHQLYLLDGLSNYKRDWDVASPYHKWHHRMLRLAREVSTWSKDPSTKVGAVIAHFDPTGERTAPQLLGLGINGFPTDVFDAPHDLANRDIKYARVVHAEVNAVLNSRGKANIDVKSYLYTWPLPSCQACTPIMLQAGVIGFFSPPPSADVWERWGASLKTAVSTIDAAGRKLYLLELEDD